MKKYGVRRKEDYGGYWIFVNSVSSDIDGKFGTDDINEAYKFMSYFGSQIQRGYELEVFEKGL